MEARATLRGPKVSRTLVAGVLVIVALGVGAAGGYVAAGVSGGIRPSGGSTISDVRLPVRLSAPNTLL